MRTWIRQTLSIWARFAILACGLAAGCGGDENTPATTTSGGSTGGAVVDWSGYCADRAALQCQQFDAAKCVEQETCALALIRDEVEAQILECLRGTCNWESCLSKTSDVPQSSAGEAFFNACAKRITECGLSDDSCYAGNLIADAGIAKLSACLDLATCAETDTCMSTYFATDFETCGAWR